MRFFILDKYNTWYDWRLTLAAKSIPEAEPKTNYITLDGRSGTLDATEALTGEVEYNDRTITASFRTSEGTHKERVALLDTIMAELHGRKVKIIEPDDTEHYFYGRIKIKSPLLDQVHLEFTLEAVCDPWRYAINETERVVAVNGDTSVVIRNNGRLTLCPELAVLGAVSVSVNNATTELTEGTYKITDLRLRRGVNIIPVSGHGSITFTYREAGL